MPMPNSRKSGWVVRSYSVPLSLHIKAAAKAKAAGVTLSAVIREALERFVREEDP